MSDAPEKYPPGKPRDPTDLRAQIMDANIPKNDAEWWAGTHIARLEAALAGGHRKLATYQSVYPDDKELRRLLSEWNDILSGGRG